MCTRIPGNRADAPSPCQITRGRGFENDKTFCVGLARAALIEEVSSMSMLPSPCFMITALPALHSVQTLCGSCRARVSASAQVVSA